MNKRKQIVSSLNDNEETMLSSANSHKYLSNSANNVSQNTSLDFTAKTKYRVELTPSSFKDKVFYVANYALITVGIFNLVTQFVQINLFGIIIRN